MTMTEIKKEFNKQKRFCKQSGLKELVSWYDEEMSFINELYTEGFAKYFTNDILRIANGYAINTGDENFSVITTLDLRIIIATKTSARKFAEYMLRTEY